MNIKTNTNGELLFENGKFVIVRDMDSIAQNIRSNIKTWKGEWFLNNQLGVDYIRGFQKGQTAFMRISLKQAILDTVGVLEIENFEFTVDSTRHAFLTCNIQTIDGVIKYKDEVLL